MGDRFHDADAALATPRLIRELSFVPVTLAPAHVALASPLSRPDPPPAAPSPVMTSYELVLGSAHASPSQRRASTSSRTSQGATPAAPPARRAAIGCTARYVRRLADLAGQGTLVRLHLQVRRFRCVAEPCQRRTFTERLPTFVPPHTRRTDRLTDLVTRVDLALGGEAGARLLPTLGAAASAATVLRLVQRMPDTPEPRTRIAETCHRQGITPGTLTLHADRGASMTSRSVAQMLCDLEVAKTHSRPHVSNDNPYSEALFKTLKYRPDFPDRFGSQQDARALCGPFFDWYNHEHHHVGIALLTPADVHHGRVEERVAARDVVLAAAYAEHRKRHHALPPRGRRRAHGVPVASGRGLGPLAHDGARRRRARRRDRRARGPSR